MAYEIVYRASAYTGRPRGIGDWDALPATDSFDGIPAAVDAITQLQAMGGEWAAELGVREIGELYPAEIIATRDNLSIGRLHGRGTRRSNLPDCPQPRP